MNFESYIRGYAKAKLSTAHPNLAINILTQKGIPLRNVSITDNTVSFNIRKSTAKYLLAVCPEAEIRIYGLTTDIRHFLHHKLLILCILLLFCLWFVSGQLVWEFEVSGNESVTEFEILRILNENGLKYGSIGILVNSEKLSNIMLCEIPELSWFAVNISGSRAYISVRERVAKPDIIDPYAYKNVYAEKSGKVLSVLVYDGTRIVGVGDMVEKGDLLVSGITESYTGVRQEHALARIYAETAYELAASMPISCKAKKYTDEACRKYSIALGSLRLNLYYHSSCDFKSYDTSLTEKQLAVFGRELPVKLITTTYSEYTSENTELTIAECESTLKAELSDMLRREINGDVLSAAFETNEENGIITVTLTAKCRERIA